MGKKRIARKSVNVRAAELELTLQSSSSSSSSSDAEAEAAEPTNGEAGQSHNDQDTSHNTNHNTTTATQNSNEEETAQAYPVAWPLSARRRGAELEDQLRHAPPLPEIRVAMIVGFAVLHSNPLQSFAQRGVFHSSLLGYLRQRGLMVVPYYTTGALVDLGPQIIRVLAAMNQGVMALEQHHLRQQQQQKELLKRQQQEEQLKKQQKQQLKKQKQQRQPTDSSNSQQAPEEVYNGPAHPMEGLDLKGWTQKTIRRGPNGITRGRVDHYWYTPQHKCILRSKMEVQRFLDYLGNAEDECYQSEPKAAEKAKRAGKRKYATPAAAEALTTPTAPTTTATATVLK